MTETPLDDFIRRVREYQAEGYDSSHTFHLAAFEGRVEQWPSGWGDDFVALVFGDFQPPAKEIVFGRLGITLEPEKLKDTVIKSALTVIRARVKVGEKSVAAVKDAARRLNLLVGILSYTNQGAPIRWWSYITTLTGGSLGFRLGDGNPEFVLEAVDRLPPEIKHKVTAALYWLREPRGMLLEHHRTDDLAIYAGYWNAFECLVDAAEILAPYPRPTRADKKQAIKKRLEKVGGDVGPREIAELYHEVVDPGLRAKAEHAIRKCASAKAEDFIKHCFAYTPADHGLYAIRNRINHGAVDVDDPETVMIVASRFRELWALVFTMFSGVLRLSHSAHESNS